MMRRVSCWLLMSDFRQTLNTHVNCAKSTPTSSSSSPDSVSYNYTYKQSLKVKLYSHKGQVALYIQFDYCSTRGLQMVRHKKDNFSSRGKKFGGGNRQRPAPRGDRDNEYGSSKRPPFKAACWDLGHCDPKRCSGKKLMNFGLMRELHIGQKHQGVIISYLPTLHPIWSQEIRELTAVT